MEIIRPVFSDKNVAVRICYAGVIQSSEGAEPTLYHDKDCSRPLKPEEVLDAYLKGVVICDPKDKMGSYYTPVAYIRKPTYSALMIIGADEGESTSIHLVKIKSEQIQLPG